MPRRDYRSERTVGVVAARTTILVYCGGRRTEPLYFDGLRRTVRNSAVTVKVRHDGVAPAQLVRLAADYRDRRAGAYDQTWCVVDVDAFDLASAVQEARRRDVRLAVSNPCFELWLLLHHADCRSFCDGFDDVASRLKRHVPEYDKTRLSFADYSAGLRVAVGRAKRLDPTGTAHERNPSTGVWRVVERIENINA